METKSMNPFLMDDMPDYGQTQTISSNPFLSSDFGAEPAPPDNPFLSASFTDEYQADANSTNPFASFGEPTYEQHWEQPEQGWDQPQQTYEQPQQAYEQPQQTWEQPQQTWEQPQQIWQEPQQNWQPQQAQIAPSVIEDGRPNDLGFLTPETDLEKDFLASSDDERPRRPPPPRPEMAKETKDLILSVTGAMEATSHHLLDRLPPTRAPSPTALTDLHSPSPTPEVDLLGEEAPATKLPSFPSNDNINFLSQSPHVETTGPPTRPPPARPIPPKPAPPQTASHQPVAHQEDDMFDLFGTTSKPQLPKTTDAILNLYSQPREKPKQVDLLSDDILEPSVVSIEPSMPLEEPNLMGPEPTSTTETTEVSSTETVIEKNQVEVKQDEVDESQSIKEQPEATIFGVPPDKKHSIPSEVIPEPEVPKIQPEPVKPSRPSPPQRPAVPPPRPAPPPVITTVPSVTPEPEPFIFGTSSLRDITPEPRNEPTIFGTTPAAEPTIFGTNTKTESSMFENEDSSSVMEPSIFGTVPKTQQSTFFEVPEEPAIFGSVPRQSVPPPVTARAPFASKVDSFDDFAAKFEKADHKEPAFDPFGGSGGGASIVNDAWGAEGGAADDSQGFGGEDGFDAFLSMSEPPPAPQPTPNRISRTDSGDSDKGGFNIFIKPREGETYQPMSFGDGTVPVLAPPPDNRVNPFDKSGDITLFPTQDGVPGIRPLNQLEPYEGGFTRSDSQETPPTPLFDEDVSQPLEDFPRIHYSSDGWEMQLRQPNKKKITGQRFWKKIFVKVVYQGDNPVLQLYNLKEDKDPFQELPLQACYSVSDISAQQYDQYGKIFTIKLQYIFYKERPGVRPGQVTKAERITNKLSKFAQYAIQGDYEGVKEFGSDLRKLGLPVEHAPQISQLLKLGCIAYEEIKKFSVIIEECLFKMPAHRDRALNYKMEEVQITVVDEVYVEQDAYGHVEKQIARVRVFFLGFLSGMPDVELGLNDIIRQGKEVVGRHDIIPVVTEEWIRFEALEFHSCVQQEEYERTRTIKFKPPDACYIELMRFRVRPPKNRELPLQLKAVMCVTGNKVELRADVLVPGIMSRKQGLIPCEDVAIRFPIPECWIYLFRVEKHFRYGSVKSAHRRTGKIKGIERFLGAVDVLEPSLIEVTSGQAKYEHHHRSIVWRMARLPKEGQGAYTTHNLVCRMQLTSFDQIPDNLADYAYIEFTMPSTAASHTTARSVSFVDSPSDTIPEKYVRQLSRHEYRVGIEHTQGGEQAAYLAATAITTKPEPVIEEPPLVGKAESDSDSSDG